MSSNDIKTIALIGSGKVATSFATVFKKNGIIISGVSSRNLDTGKALAQKVECPFYENYLDLDADLIIVATSDQSVSKIINSFPENKTLVYTAGSVELDKITHPNCGVFYPLQTFSENRKIEVHQIPILLEAKNIHLLGILSEFCEKLEFSFQFCNSQERKLIHLTAVIVNNFVNHLVCIAEDEARKNHLEWDLFKPILNETFSKIQTMGAKESQTGPARRLDLEIIKEHQHLLSGTNLELYKLMTKSIIETYQNDKL